MASASERENKFPIRGSPFGPGGSFSRRLSYVSRLYVRKPSNYTRLEHVRSVRKIAPTYEKRKTTEKLVPENGISNSYRHPD
jgi:hypothetical protein